MITEGSSFLRADLFLCWRAVFLSANFTSEKYFLTISAAAVACFYQAIFEIFEIFEIFLKIGLRRISPLEVWALLL